MMKTGKKGDSYIKIIHTFPSSDIMRRDGEMNVTSGKKSWTENWQLMTGIAGVFCLIVSGIFLALLTMISEYIDNCTHMPPEEALAICKLSPENHTTALNLMTTLAVFNGLQFGCSLGLMWGATKDDFKYVTGWLILSLIWIHVHIIMALLYVVAIADTIYAFNLSALAIFLLAINILGMYIVQSYRQDMLTAEYHKMKGVPQFKGSTLTIIKL